MIYEIRYTFYRCSYSTNARNLLRHVITKTWNNGVTYTPKETGFLDNTPNASKKKTALTSLFAVRITDGIHREKYERGIGGAIVDKIIAMH